MAISLPFASFTTNLAPLTVFLVSLSILLILTVFPFKVIVPLIDTPDFNVVVSVVLGVKT